MSAATVTSPPRIEARPGPAQPPRRAAKKRMLMIVNPYATTVSDRLKNLVVYALQGRYEVEAVSTQAQNHATQICREAREEGYDIVVAFGGDGTLNEVANGLAGTDVPVSVLPGGSTNVVCRTLGIPNDVVDATEHLLGLADDFEPRRIDLGIANGRHFVFSCGAGLDATAAAPRRREAAAEAQGRPLVLHLLDGRRLLHAVPAQPGPDERRGRGPGQRRGRHRADPELGPVHLLRRSSPCGSARAPRSTTARCRWRCCAARPSATCRRSRRGSSRPASACPSTARSTTSRASHERASSRSHATPRTGSVPSPCRSTATPIGNHGELDLGIDPGALTVVA